MKQTPECSKSYSQARIGKNKCDASVNDENENLFTQLF